MRKYTVCSAESGALSAEDAGVDDSLWGGFEGLTGQAKELMPWAVPIRRKLHQFPELMYQELNTSSTIQSYLKDMGANFTTGWGVNKYSPPPNPYKPPSPADAADPSKAKGGTGIVVHIGSGESPCVLLRADMDALPIDEQSDVSFKSEVRGKMHACGHDGHVTMLLMATKLLIANQKYIKGTIRIIFQPAEEGGGGGSMMVEEGVISVTPRAQRAFALHLWPTYPTGTVATRPGPLLGGANIFQIKVMGQGGHAAMPHNSIDPIPPTASIVSALQALASRELSFTEETAGVVSVTALQAGDSYNVIPSQSIVKGTIRSFTSAGLENLKQRVMQVATGIAQAHRCTADVEFSKTPYPPTVNDRDVVAFAQQVIPFLSVDVPPTLGGEDFSFITQATPGAMFFLGSGSNVSLHSPHFVFDEETMPYGAALHAQLALTSLQNLDRQKLHMDRPHEEL